METQTLYTADIRERFTHDLKNEKNFTIDSRGNATIELIGASFVADEPSIFGEPNEEYIKAEIEWYQSQSTNVNALEEIYGKTPAAWTHTANKHGEINSNYGKLIWSDKYFSQYGQVLDELLDNQGSRRASMIYNRPSIWLDYNEDGKNDFICTNAVTYYIRRGKLHAVVQMRSNDAVYGYKNDYAWQKYVLDSMVESYNYFQELDERIIEPGTIVWQVQNLHLYERHFNLV